MVPSRAAHDVLAGMLEVLSGFGGVPRKAVWDQEGCIGQIRRGKQVLTAEFQAFRGVLGMGAVLVGPNDPEAKGLVERANGYLETSFLPGRSFEDIGDFNRQLAGWVEESQPADPRHYQGETVGGDLRGPGSNDELPACVG